jgi:hypothetical protein
MMSFRDVHRIKPHREVSLTRRRVVALVAVQCLLAGGAFAGGYVARGGAPVETLPAVSVGLSDPLAALDSRDVRVDYRYHDLLTAPRREPPPPSAAAEATIRTGIAPRVPRRVERARKILPKRAIAAREVRGPDHMAPASDADELRALEAQVQQLARKSARTRAGGAARTNLSTDDELLTAIGEGGAVMTRESEGR